MRVCDKLDFSLEDIMTLQVTDPLLISGILSLTCKICTDSSTWSSFGLDFNNNNLTIFRFHLHHLYFKAAVHIPFWHGVTRDFTELGFSMSGAYQDIVAQGSVLSLFYQVRGISLTWSIRPVFFNLGSPDVARLQLLSFLTIGLSCQRMTGIVD